MLRSWWQPPAILLGISLGMAPASAQESSPTGTTKPAAKPPPNDPRKGPRLAYTRGPTACLPESAFRDEVAIILDGVDHFSDQSVDVVTVRFEKLPGGYRGTIVYTNAQGKVDPPTVKTYYNCELLGRWIAGTASGFIPPPPDQKLPSGAPSASAAASGGAPSAAPSAAPTSAPATSSTVRAVPMLPAPPRKPPAAPSSMFPLCVPSATLRGVLGTLTCAGVLVVLAGAGTTIGLEVARNDLKARLTEDACDPALPLDSERCAALTQLRLQRNVAAGITFGSVIVTTLLGAATGLVSYRARTRPNPSIAPTISTQGGGFVVVGAW